MVDKLRIGIIGGMGRGPMVGMMLNQTGQAEVVAVADLNPAAFEVGRERFETCGAKPQLYTDTAAMLRRDDLDWVVVGTPDRSHFAVGRQVVEAGHNCFLEKPMTQTLEDADELCRIVERAGVKLVVGCELRYTPFVEAFRKAIRAGMIGRPVAGNCVAHEGRGYCYFLRDHRQKQWGHGLLLQKGIHSIDMMNDLVDADPIRVYGSGALSYFGQREEARDLHCRDCPQKDDCQYSFYTVTSPTWVKGGPREKNAHAFDHCVWKPDTDTEDNVHLLVDYASGFRLSYTHVYFSGFVARKLIWFWGTQGVLYGVMDKEGCSLTYTPLSGAMKPQASVEIPLGKSQGAHGGGDERFAQAIVQAGKAGEGLHPDVYEGRNAVAVAALGRRSMETHQAIEIPVLRRGGNVVTQSAPQAVVR